MKVLTSHRVLLVASTPEKEDALRDVVETMGYFVQATDGVWLPRCDVNQYEAGGRPVRITKTY